MVNAEGGRRTSEKAAGNGLSFAARWPLLPNRRGIIWVRYFGRKRVFDRARAVFLGSFRNFSFRATREFGRFAHENARNLRRMPSPRAAWRPYRYITPQVIALPRGSERSGRGRDPDKCRGMLRDGVTTGGFEDSRGRGFKGSGSQSGPQYPPPSSEALRLVSSNCQGGSGRRHRACADHVKSCAGDRRGRRVCGPDLRGFHAITRSGTSLPMPPGRECAGRSPSSHSSLESRTFFDPGERDSW
jgi:hypothetical protein